jgi:hypothetical protein
MTATIAIYAIHHRADRTPAGRLRFASAMALTGHQDGDDASTGASYLEIARVLIDHGTQTDADLHELWSRIVFNMLVSNTDGQAVVRQWRQMASAFMLAGRSALENTTDLIAI